MHVCVLVLGGTTLFVVVLCIIMHFLVLSEVAEQREEKKNRVKYQEREPKGSPAGSLPPVCIELCSVGTNLRYCCQLQWVG